jgi:hypothetical protein
MNADSDTHPVAALFTKLLRATGKQVRRMRGDPPSFHPECTDLETDRWRPEAFPGVAVGQAASDLVHDELASDHPSMICRLGATELATVTSATTPLTAATALKLISGDVIVRDIGLHAGLVNSLCLLSGFFPGSVSEGRRFVSLMLEDMRLIDVLGVWCKQEVRFEAPLSAARRVRFRDLEPYMHQRPWSRMLAGRRVLVIHPFAETIEMQYHDHRAELFANAEVLPEFELLTIKAVQSIAHNETQFATWFDALDHMKRQIDACRFDIAIIGCGAYGLPLAAHVKRIGRKAVHLGGQTQLLFGIKGKRWETGHERIQALFNEHWVYPSDTDKPRRYTAVEGGAYW